MVLQRCRYTVGTAEDEKYDIIREWMKGRVRLVVEQGGRHARLDAHTIRSTMLARHEWFGNDPYVMIVVVPAGMEFSMSFLESDQYANTRVEDAIIGMANVVEDADVRAVVSIYYAQHPPQYAFTVVSTMAQALAWAQPLVAAHRKA